MTGAIPPDVTPPEMAAFCLEVPDSVEWFGLVTGALLKLSYGYYWDKSYENWEGARDTGQVIVNSWLSRERCGDSFCSGIVAAIAASDGTVNSFLEQIIAQAFELCNESLATAVQEGIEALIPSFAVRHNEEEPCVLEFSNDGGETWSEFANVSTCGAQGETGATGETGAIGAQGEPGEPGTDCDNCQTSPNPVGEDSRVKACSVAYGVTQWLFEKYNDGLDLIDELVIADRAVLDIVSDTIEAIPVVGNFVEFAVDFVTNAATADIAALHACDTTDFRDEVYCALFCAIGDDGIITDEILADWADDVQSIGDCTGVTTTIGAALKSMMKAIGGAAFRQRGFIYSNGEAPCPDCDDCPTAITITHHTDAFACATSGTVSNDTPEIGDIVDFASTLSPDGFYAICQSFSEHCTWEIIAISIPAGSGDTDPASLLVWHGGHAADGGYSVTDVVSGDNQIGYSTNAWSFSARLTGVG